MDLLDLNNEECCDHQTFLLEFWLIWFQKVIFKKIWTKEKKEIKKIQIAHIKLFTFNKQNKFLFPEYIDQIHKILLLKWIRILL